MMTTTAELLDRYREWAENRNSLGEVESNGGTVPPSLWHYSDDDGVELAHALAAELDRLTSQ